MALLALAFLELPWWVCLIIGSIVLIAVIFNKRAAD
jgi:hypothetical protein